MKDQGLYLKTCNTCMRILGELNLPEEYELQEVKSAPATAEQIDELAKMAGCYEALFNRRSKKYRELGLHEQDLSEDEYRKHLLEKYTFLKRPVFVIDGELYMGNSKKTVEAAKEKLKNRK
ncbi:MAG: ArsC/Spx/MgsR family protein [Cyclobacteriaceae bacterium]